MSARDQIQGQALRTSGPAVAAAVAATAAWRGRRGVAVAAAAATAVGVRDLLQKSHAILRAYPLVGHARYALESFRPEIRQYFIESDTDGRPFNRDERSIVYQRAKGENDKQPFGTELDVYAPGYDLVAHSMAPVPAAEIAPMVRVGGRDCRQPHDFSLLNISAMSFGSLSSNAITALNRGARDGNFTHDTGEGGVSPYHRQGGDLLWQIGTGYFGCRASDGTFDVSRFVDTAADPAVKAISLKLSQGAKPGHGGVLPGAKVTPEIAAARGVPVGQTVNSPAAHSAFSTPIEMLGFIADIRERSGGKPVGIKFCVGHRTDVLAICKAMIATGIQPDFIQVDGGEGGTGAAPLEYSNHVGRPLTDGLGIVHDALVGTGLRDDVVVAVAGRIVTGIDIIRRIAQGADLTFAARPMMLALGCIQAQECHTNHCPVGVATQDPYRTRALDPTDKAERVRRYHEATMRSALEIMGSMGLRSPSELTPDMVLTRTDAGTLVSHAELHPGLSAGELLAEPPAAWERDWRAATADRF